MRTTRSFFGLIMALLPILWIGGLLLYLNNVRGAFGGLLDGALGPTLMGLGTVLIIFVFLFVLKFWRAATPPATGGGSGSGGALEEEKSDFDPDAALARYMARRNGEPGAPPPTFGGGGGGSPRPGGFGRKTV
jgi:hypothetical protein